MNRIRTDGIIWDVDGTLWDSTEIVARAWTHVLQDTNAERRARGLAEVTIHHPAGGGTGSSVTAEDLRREFGRPLADIIRELVPDLDPEDADVLLHRWYDAEDSALRNDAPAAFHGLSDVLQKLHQMCIPSFIVSNCQAGYIETFMADTHTESFFQDHLCIDDTSLLKADNIRLIVERYHLTHPCYVGDIQADCDATREADRKTGPDTHISFIWASYGFGHVDHPDAVLSAVTDLPECIRPLR